MSNRVEYRGYLLKLLLLILAFNFADRWALGLVLQDIKVDLRLSDTELGFLGGIAFALFYSVMGIPIARWADRGNRVAIITLTTALWSAAVMMCGVVVSFFQLLLARVLIGVGESGCIPPAHSLIADLFTRAERPRAVAIYMQGISVSGVLGYFVAGWLNQLYGWRAMFVIMGLPGLPLAALAWLTLREPRRGRSSTSPHSSSSERGAAMGANVASGDPLRLKEVVRVLWAMPTFRHLLYAYSVMYFFSYGIQQWTPAFFIREYGMKSGPLGNWLAAICGLGCVLGTYCGGEWAVRRAAGNERLQLRTMTMMICISGIFGAFVYLPVFAPGQYASFAWLGIYMVLATTINGPLLAVIQTLVPERMRAMSIALVYLCANLIGMGFGPMVAGILSDGLQPWLGGESLRYALVGLSLANVPLAWHLWQASKTVTADLEATQLSPDGPLLAKRAALHSSI